MIALIQRVSGANVKVAGRPVGVIGAGLVALVGVERGDTEVEALILAERVMNYRIFADAEAITVFNSERFVRGTDIQTIFAQLDVDDAAHAFYLGKELAKASLAVALGKTYRQEGALAWGYLTPPDENVREHVPLTQRPRRPRASGNDRDGS